jgi:nucleotide-binding universal stress UspA family protein
MSEANGVTAIPTKILVPIDFSPSSHTALETAVVLAEKFGAELLLLSVVEGFSSVTLPESVCESSIAEEAKKEAERHFAATKAALDAKGIKTTTVVEIDRDVAGNILEAVEREHCDLLVMSTHGVSGWYPVVFGSVTEKVIKLVHTPLLLLRTEKPESSVKIPSGRLMEWW